MIRLMQYQGKKLGVLGLGKTGLAALRALRESGAEIWVWDDNSPLPENLTQDKLCHFQPVEAWPWAELAAMVMSPGIPLTHPEPHRAVKLAKEAGCRITSDIDLLFEACPTARYIGITGTNGKSTTTALIAHLVKEAGIPMQVGGNLGQAVLEFQPMGEEGIFVLELSSYQLDLLDSLQLDAAVLLNITPDHLDRHGGMEGYITAKNRIFSRLKPQGTAIIATDDSHTQRLFAGVIAKGQPVAEVSVTHRVENGVDGWNGILQEKHGGQATAIMDITAIGSLTGAHNWQNAAAAYAACRALGIGVTELAAALPTFGGLAHRMERVGETASLLFINDSKATNAEATENALKPFRNIYWILGGQSKEGGIAPLEPLFGHIRHAYLMGAAEEEFAATLEGKVPYRKCGHLNEAFAAAVADAQEAAQASGEKANGEKAVILLSPACASWDQWKSFEHRGDAFRTLVQEFLAQQKNEPARKAG